MARFLSCKATHFLVLVLLVSLAEICAGSRKLNSLYQPPPTLLTYHKGALLQGGIPVSLLWYGKFTSAQKSIISDFLLSLTPEKHQQQTSSYAPSVSKWWRTVDNLVVKAGKRSTRLSLANQVSDEHYSIGKLLDKSQLPVLASRTNSTSSGLVIVLTSEDVALDGFCMHSCGSHGRVDATAGPAYIWVGNPASQCPGQCAWPFHQPMYGPQSPPLVPPNGDVGVDGMIINIATLLAGTVTNPFGDGYFEGDAGAPVEVGSACTGVYGKGAYPGYAGQLLVDGTTEASYNVEGVDGRK